MIPGIVATTTLDTTPPALEISGIYSNTFASYVSVPSGAGVGDLLVSVVTAGAVGVKTVPTGFTPVLESTSGSVGIRTMQAGDKNFALASTSYGAVIAVRRAVGSPTIDAVSTVNEYTTNQTFQTPTVNPTETGDMALMIFMSAWGAMKSPQPAYSNLIPYNRSGAGGCGMAISGNLLPTANAFTGTSCGGVAQSGLTGSALTLLIK